jgi:geranylgeranyl reductase family protein
VIVRSSPQRVIVVGGGPAGATAARTLAASGVPVQLLDRAAFPRNKPCGGGISMRALARFPHLERELPRISTHTVSRLRLEGPGGSSAVVESRRPAALLIRRVEFDALLVSLARDAGADVIPGADVVQAHEDSRSVSLVTRDGRRFEAPMVIAADGVHSVVARRLGLNAGWRPSAVALDMMEETPRTLLRDRDPSSLWVAYGYEPRGSDRPKAAERSGRAASEGYAYIFPKRDHVNVGIGFVLEHFRRRVTAAPYDLQRHLVERLRERGIVDGTSVRANFTPFLIPVGGPLARAGRGRVLLAGDAAGFVNGFTAEGIYYAMASGELAADAVIRTGADPAGAAAAYRRACDYEFGAELRDSVAIQRFLFADCRRIDRVVDGAQREAAMTRLLVDFACGAVSYRQLRLRLLARSPLLAGRVLWERLGRLAAKNSVVERSSAS